MPTSTALTTMTIILQTSPITDVQLLVGQVVASGAMDGSGWFLGGWIGLASLSIGFGGLVWLRKLLWPR